MISELGLCAYQLGLDSNGAVRALEIGARMLAHGFTESELDDMVKWQYNQWAEQEQEVQGGNPRTWVLRRVQERLEWVHSD